MNEQTSLFNLDEPVSPATEAAADIAPAELRNPRQMAFSMRGRGAALLLRATFTGKRYGTAAAVYDALTELASEARTPAECQAARRDVARLASVTDRTVDLYVREFERIGLLEVVRRRGGLRGGNLLNVYRLLQVRGDERLTLAQGEVPFAPERSQGEVPFAPERSQGEAGFAHLKKNDTEETNVVVRLKDRSRVPSPREAREARRARRAAALDSLIDQRSG